MRRQTAWTCEAMSCFWRQVRTIFSTVPLLRFLVALVVVIATNRWCLAAEPPRVRDVVRQVVGHRGSCANSPENTLASIQQAIAAGATAVEFDLRRTRDKQLVLMHDASVEKTTNGRGLVADLTLAEIRQLDAGSWFNKGEKRFPGERVPTFAEALTACRGRIDTLLDLKEQGDAFDHAVIDEVRKRGEPKRTIVGVRSLEQAKRFRQLLPEARQLGLIARQNEVEDYAAAGVETIRLWPYWLDDQSLVARVRKTGAKLHLGVPIGTPEEVLPLLRYRPASMSADDPARLIKTLSEAPASSLDSPNSTR